MVSLTKSKKIVFGLAAVSGAAAYYYLNIQNPNKKVYAAWTTNYVPSPHAIWDENWDHRSPKSLKNPKHLQNETDENKLNEKLEALTPKVCRHLILIRHGQYNLSGKNDEERILTKLGRIQADYTGKRLKELGMPYTNMIKSTMSRAQETGTIISESLPEVPVTHCDFLREGAPIPPEPPLGRYKPELYQYFQDGSRIEAAFRKYFHRADPSQEKDSYTILVCHANVIRYFVCRAMQFPAEGLFRMSLNHASITWISILPDGACVLRTLGDSGYMPPDIISTNRQEFKLK